jgi:ADP-heptose:LPS heptosyltransferase
VASYLQIAQPRERRLVAAADRVLQFGTAVARPFRRRRRPAQPRRILLFRLERIGDLLMALPAIADVRAAAPDAEIDLIVGSWNRTLAEAITAVTRVHTLDPAWLAREGAGQGLGALLRAGAAFRASGYDVAINFEPDVRSNLLVARTGAAWTAGYRSGGGGPLLDVALDYDPRAHTADNARRLVAAVFDRAVGAGPATLNVPAAARSAAATLLDGRRGPFVGVHASGGRDIKQWPVERFADVAARVARERGATIVLTGAAQDRVLVDRIAAHLPPERVVDAAGTLDLVTLAALLQRLDVFITGDTGPMHLAHAVGTPIVAVFGPSDPARYAPRGPLDRVVRIDLPCAPCNRIRLPPERCTGHTPDCLAGISVEQVMAAVADVLHSRSSIGSGGPAR